MQAAKSVPDAQQTKPEVSVRLAHGPEVCTTTYTIQDPFGISRGAGGRKGWRILTACTKNKKQNVTNSFLIPEIFSRQKCMGKRRRGVPAVAADFSIHLYMHKNTNKRQHT